MRTSSRKSYKLRGKTSRPLCYFHKVDIEGLTIQVTLSESLAAMKPTLSAVHPVTGAILGLSPVGNQNLLFQVNNFEPEHEVAETTSIQITAMLGDSLSFTDSATIDTIKLPKWLTKLKPTASFDIESNQYTFIANILNIDTLDDFTLLEKSGKNDFWLGEGLKNGIRATVSVTIEAALNPTHLPGVVGTASTDVVFLSDTLFQESTTLGQGTGLTVDLDPRTLELREFSFEYVLDGNFSSPFIAEGASFRHDLLLITPTIEARSVEYFVKVNGTFDADGKPIEDQSSVEFRFNPIVAPN